MNSAIYAGQVSHRRFSPVMHEFSYKLFMMYIDLQELPWLFKKYRLWSFEKANLASFKSTDHYQESGLGLEASIRRYVQTQTGNYPEGDIRLLTHFRYFGMCFNPVSFYYCYAKDAEHLDYIVCEVNNTPWNQRHLYLLDCKQQQLTGKLHKFSQQKSFHVSPFMPMDMQYEWSFSRPDDVLSVFMSNRQQGEKVFDATLKLEKLPITQSNLAKVLVMYPLMTMKVVVLIYYQALRLWLKKVPFFTHPEKINSTGEYRS